MELEAFLSLELDGLLAKEDMKWNQKSKELWVKEGDRNTRYFHLSTIIRRRRNFISEIKLDDGSRINSREEIQNYFIDNFKALYQTSFPPIPDDLSNLIEPCVSDKENESFCMQLKLSYHFKRLFYICHVLCKPHGNNNRKTYSS